ncbi:leucine-rich repeat protein, partial [Pseudomonadales bacterium]|nr:leucine-rich repeat protein [Pseudomonadales bacterium]
MKYRSIKQLCFLITCVVSLFAYADDDGTLVFSVNGDSLTVTGCVDICPEALVIPSKIQDVPVTSIGREAFKNTALTSVVIPDSVTAIGNWAFNGASSLSAVTLGAGLLEIGSYAFRNTSLTSVTIPNSVTSIGGNAFEGATDLVSVTFGSGLVSISGGMFSNASSLTSIEIPDSVTTIGNSAFQGASSLSAVSIPDSVTTIGEWAFSGTALASLLVPDSVTSIGNYAFREVNSLTSISLGSGITSVGYGAFQNICSNKLLSATLNLSVIPDELLEDCTQLNSLTLGETVTSIGREAFKNTALTSVVIPDSVTAIGNSAFYPMDGDVVFLVAVKNDDTIAARAAQFNFSLSFGDSVTAHYCLDINTDGDRFLDCTDLDDDNDGILDDADKYPLISLAGLADTDGNGVPDTCDNDCLATGMTADQDDDGDGVDDSLDAFPLDASETIDTDLNGIGNNADPDDDNDGLLDSEEQVAGTNPLLADTDADGVTDNVDQMPLDLSERIDTDGDGIGNRVDVDDDDDFVPDSIEIANGTDPLVADTDRDGIPDGVDLFPQNANEYLDTDGDGIGNNADRDDDDDGVIDGVDAFPLDKKEQADTDGDGVGNFLDNDDDGDEIVDREDAFPLNPNEVSDTDNDGRGNNADLDDDNDGVPDADDAFPRNSLESIDTDRDGIGNGADRDDDGDGVHDDFDAFPLNANESVDTDSDGIGNNQDTDDDNDGVLDQDDALPLSIKDAVDTDGDGVGNNADLDDDGDRVSDDNDAFPLDGSEWLDTDNDRIGNNSDSDDDGDGVADTQDAFPLNSSESVDTDGDGIGNNADTDDDGDGIADRQDAFPLKNTESTDFNGNGIGDNDDDRAELVTLEVEIHRMISYLGSFAVGFADGPMYDLAGESDDWTTPIGQSESASIRCDAGGIDITIQRTGYESVSGTVVVNNCTNGRLTASGSFRFSYNDAFYYQDTPLKFYPLTYSFSNLRVQDALGRSFSYSGSLSCDYAYNSLSSSYKESWVDDNVLELEISYGSLYDKGERQFDYENLIRNDDGSTGSRVMWNTNCDFSNVSAQDGFKSHTIINAKYIGGYSGSDDPAYYISPFDRSERLSLSKNNTVSNRVEIDLSTGSVSETLNESLLSDSVVRHASQGNLFFSTTSGTFVGQNVAARGQQYSGNFSLVTQIDAFEPVVLDTVTDRIFANNQWRDLTLDVDFDNDGERDGTNGSPWVRSSIGLANSCRYNFVRLSAFNLLEVTQPKTSSTDCKVPGGFLAQDGAIYYQDANLDGINELFTNDDDQDGIEDSIDRFPNDPGESVDSDNDGIGDNADFFPNNPLTSSDVDGDGVADRLDAFPFDSSESVDTDGDGIGNNRDADGDNDGVIDSEDAFPLDSAETEDMDGDSIGNNADDDVDGDGVDNLDDAFPLDASEHLDTDLDGLGNAADDDDDNDGVLDSNDDCPLDSFGTSDLDGDGLCNNQDKDDDGDGVADQDDSQPLNAAEVADTDLDGIGDNADADDDNDGVLDTEDLFALDANEYADFDGDGVGDNADIDDDNDGVADTIDSFPRDPTEWLDSDSNGIGNNEDADDDGDSIPDAIEVTNGTNPLLADTDGDGVSDNSDVAPLNSSEPIGSGNVSNNADKDGDGVADVDDAYPLDPERSINLAPVIAMEGAAIFILNVGDVFFDPGALAFDTEDGDLTASVIVSEDVNSSTPGSYTVEYRVTDSGDITSMIARTVIVVQSLSSGAIRFAAGQVIELPVIGTALTAPNGEALAVPTTATAASINVTAVTPGGSGFITVWPCGVARPLASNLNYVAGDVVPNGVLAPIGSNGKVCLYSLVDTDLVVDVAGWFEGDAFVGATPLRLRDTRETSRVTSAQELVLQVADIDASTADGSATRVPADVGAVALNVTVVSPDSAGFVTVYPCGTRPLASNVNYTAGQIVPNGVIA